MENKRGFKSLVIVFLVLVLFVLLVLFIMRSTAFIGWDFRNNLWGPTYLLTHNQSPYRIDKLFDLGNAVWLPMAVGLFFPLGFFPLQQASNLWLVSNIIWFLLIVWISSGSRRPSISLFAIVIFLGLIFPPSVTHLWSGQFSILTTLLFMVVVIWNNEMPMLLLTLLMAVGLSKPQLAIFVLPGFILYRIRTYGIRNTVQLIAYLICWVLILTIPLFLAYPNWLPDFILEIQQNPSWAQPSSLYFLRNAVPKFGEAIWIVMAIVIFAINIWLWTVLPSRDAVFWSLALTPLITPYIWTWDFVMILPLFISSVFQAKTRASLGVLLGGYIVCWILMAGMKIHGEVSDYFFWWVPWYLVTIIICSKGVRNMKHLVTAFSSFIYKYN